MGVKHEIGARLRQFGEGKFRSMAEFARALGIRPQNLNQYLSGRQLPGNKMKDRLQELGCDPAWLILGMHKELVNHRYLESIKHQARELMKDDFAMLDYFKKIGIDNLEALEKFCDPQNIAQDVAMVLRERIAKYKITKK